MVCVSKYGKQKAFHYSHCRYFRRIKKENRVWIQNQVDAEANGFTICRNCSKIYRMFTAEQTEIKNYKRKTGYRVWYESGYLQIKTPLAYWKIVEEGSKHRPHLYHESVYQHYGDRPLINGKIDIIYHPQTDFFAEAIMGYLEYIYKHDNWRDELEMSYKNMPRCSKKKRKAYDRAKRKARKSSIRRVLNLIEQMEAEG